MTIPKEPSGTASSKSIKVVTTDGEKFFASDTEASQLNSTPGDAELTGEVIGGPVAMDGGILLETFIALARVTAIDGGNATSTYPEETGVIGADGTTAPSPPSGDDPDFISVVLLLGLDGLDGATTTTDASNEAHTINFQGNAQLDTAQKKFGDSSLDLDGTGDYLYINSDTSLNMEGTEWTFECHVRFDGDPGTSNMAFISKWLEVPFGRSYWFGLRNNELIAFFSTTGTNGLTMIAETWNPVGDQWYHIAFVRENNGAGTDFVHCYVDGVELGTGDSSVDSAGNFYSNSTEIFIGAFESSPFDYMDGWIDNVRVTKSVARYTGNFTPPTEAYPGS